MGLVTQEFGTQQMGFGTQKLGEMGAWDLAKGDQRWEFASLGLERHGRGRQQLVIRKERERERKNDIADKLVTFVFRAKGIIKILKKFNES